MKNFNPRAPYGARQQANAWSVICGLFQSTRPVWGATKLASPVPLSRARISIHAPRMGRDEYIHPRVSLLVISIHAPRMGRDRKDLCDVKRGRHFNPRAPYGARPLGGADYQRLLLISIHAPRMGRDLGYQHNLSPYQYFNPRAPYGARRLHCSRPTRARYFNPRAPYGARQIGVHKKEKNHGISIHAPRMGRDVCTAVVRQGQDISIHAPRMGRDLRQNSTKQKRRIFQSTRPVWGATAPDCSRGGNA